MLLLDRKVGQEIQIGDKVRLVVIEIRGRKVRLGFKAPRQVSIDRAEVRKKKDLLNALDTEVKKSSK